METMCHLLFVFILCLVPQATLAAECPDVAVIVVASVFATLAVVLIILGIIGFLIWKRRRDISRPEKLKNDEYNSTKSSPNGKFGYGNLAFDKDPEMGDAGLPAGYVVYQEGSLDKNKDDEVPSTDSVVELDQSSLVEKDMAKKTWSSLPVSSDLPMGRSRKSSLGSLDRNNYNADDGTVEVWLTSQDFIGLGFNIAGSMRDGIFVSQVHNRGPANESGKFKVGDRIVSVGISFENMVYEDALTILSYASPYPVKVTLQKQQQLPKNRKLSQARSNLSHPLYRSQSVDALVSPPRKESLPVVQPQRSASEMRYNDSRDSPKVSHRVSKGGVDSNITEETGMHTSSSGSVLDKNVPVSTVSAVVHMDNSEAKLAFDREVSISTDTDLPNATVDLNNDNRNIQKNSINVSVDEQNDDPFVTQKPNFSSAFEHLTEEDKLDVLRLTYDNPDVVVNNSFDDSEQVTQSDIVPAYVHGELKSAPVKPERKKKRGSTTSTTSQSDSEFPNSEPSSPTFPQLSVEDTFGQILMPPSEAPPPVPEEAEADEEIILPTTKSREISMDSDKIVFESVTPTKHDISDISIVGDMSVVDNSFSDIDTTLIQGTPNAYRSESPNEHYVQEEEISATQIDKENFVFTKSNIFVTNEVNGEEKKRKLSSSSSSSSSSSEDEKKCKNAVHEGTETSLLDSVPMPEDDFEKDLPALDMNLTFDNDSVLFKETFPNRNETEKEGGLAYDLSVIELNAMKEKSLEEERLKNEKQTGKGGIAFEIRDDVVTGSTRTVNTNSVHRTASYEIKSTSDKFKDFDISTQRPTSLKGDTHKRHDDSESGVLDWSGKRLVRSGSFTDIPQDDTIKDWTNEQNLNDDDALIEEHIQEDSKSPVLKTLTRATLIQANQSQDELSDSDSQCRSISESSSSGSSSPKRIDNNNYEGTNGEDNGLGTSPDNSPVKIMPTSDIKSELISSVAKYGENDQAFTVTLNAAIDDDEDC